MRVVSSLLALAVSLMIVGNVLAADEAPARQGRRPQRPAADQWDMFKGLNLTDDQKAKVEEIKKEYAPKVKEARQKMESILTDEQKKARAEAAKAARAAGKNRDEVRKAAQDAAKVTDEQKAKMAEARKEAGALRKEIREKLTAILTPEQKEQLKQLHQRGRGRRAESK